MGQWQPANAATAYPRTLLTPAALPALRASLLTPGPAVLYRGLYDNSLGDPPTDNTSASGRRARATFAKNAAFLLLVNRQPQAGTLAEWPEAERQAYQARVVAVLASLNPTVEAFASFTGTTYTEWQWRSKELIDYLVAYDLLRGAGVPPETLLPARTRLQQFAGNLYREANRPFLGVYFFRQIKNNHALMTATALGMAAVVLNDATSTDLNQQPVNWINAGLFHLDNVLWEDVQRQSDPTTVAGYAEGPYYFKYAFLNCLPFIRALGQFAPTASFTCSYNGLTRTIPNPYSDPRYERLYEWMSAITMPDGRFPALEDSYVDMGMPELALTGQARYVQPLYLARLGSNQLNTLTAQLRDATVDMRAAYLAALPNPAPVTHPTLTHLPASGNLIFRSGSDSLATYFHVYGKSGAAQANSGGHNQADATSFILHARGQLLALDAGYLSYNRRTEVGQASNHNLILVDGSGPAIGTAGSPNDAPVSLPTAFATPELAFGEARTTYQGATITRKTLFIRNQYVLLADFVVAPLPHTYTWQLHGYGLEGGTSATGTFQATFANEEAIWEKNGVQLRAHVTTPGPAPTFGKTTNVHELAYNTPENHTTLLVKSAASTQTQFLAALYPGEAATDPAQFTTRSTAATAALTATDHGFRDAAFTQSDTLLTTATGLPETLASDARLTFLSVDSTGRPVQLFLDQGTQLRYGSRMLLQASHRATISWQQDVRGSYAGYADRATTLVVYLPAAPGQVAGTGVRGSSYDPATQQLTVELTAASALTVQMVAQPLPVTLVRFAAQRKTTGIVLSWQTAAELNNHGFALQRRSTTDAAFRTINFVPTKGTPAGPASYLYTDPTAPAETVYYRLQQQDLDGITTYSGVVVVAAVPAGTAVLQAAPVPAHDVVHVTGPAAFPAASSLELLDSRGRIVLRQPLLVQTQLATMALPAGVYFLRAVDVAGSPLAPPLRILVAH